MLLLRGPGPSFAPLITALLTLLNIYFVTLSPLDIYILLLGSLHVYMYGSPYLKSYVDQDLIYANFICYVRITGSYNFEDVII